MRIQVLHLPGHSAGELQEDRFALIVDQVETEEVQSASGKAVRIKDGQLLQDFGREIGAQGVLVTPLTVEVY